MKVKKENVSFLSEQGLAPAVVYGLKYVMLDFFFLGGGACIFLALSGQGLTPGIVLG